MPRFDAPPVNIGHRGHARSTENTIRSFLESIELGAQMLELDVRTSRDGEAIVFHDKNLWRMAKKRGKVADRSSKFLTNLEPSQGQKIPTLDAVLKEISPLVPVNIEMKFDHFHYRPLVTAVLRSIDRHQASSRVLVSSFSHQSLEILNRQAPHIPTAPLYLNVWTGYPHQDDIARLSQMPSWETSIPFERPAAVVHHKMIDQQMSDTFREANLNLLTFTVDEPEDLKRMISLGVDGIVTNHPDILRELLSQGN